MRGGGQLGAFEINRRLGRTRRQRNGGRSGGAVLFEGKASVVGSEALRLAAVLVFLTYCRPSPLQVQQCSTAIREKVTTGLKARP